VVSPALYSAQDFLPVTRMSRITLRLLSFALVALLCACGQKGDLVRPPATPDSGKATPVSPNP